MDRHTGLAVMCTLLLFALFIAALSWPCRSCRSDNFTADQLANLKDRIITNTYSVTPLIPSSQRPLDATEADAGSSTPAATKKTCSSCGVSH